jgi:hypothetical protein
MTRSLPTAIVKPPPSVAAEPLRSSDRPDRPRRALFSAVRSRHNARRSFREDGGVGDARASGDDVAS